MLLYLYLDVKMTLRKSNAWFGPICINTVVVKRLNEKLKS